PDTGHAQKQGLALLRPQRRTGDQVEVKEGVFGPCPSWSVFRRRVSQRRHLGSWPLNPSRRLFLAVVPRLGPLDSSTMLGGSRATSRLQALRTTQIP
ncbi:hypothetical protein CCUS01_15458, partial [Colletotrichum cuscutae]